MKAIGSVTEYVEAIIDLKKSWDPNDLYLELWYRGANNSKNRLLPGAYWRTTCDETSMVASFRAMSPSLLTREPLDAWEWYYLMQHYGLPTRLLDWSESPLAALYFALESAHETASPCVWVLDPLALNRLSGLDLIPVPRTDGPTRRWLTAYCGRGKSPRSFKKTKNADWKDNSRPLAIFPKRHNPRIVAQRGAFTVHGTAETPIDALPIKDLSGQESRLIKIPIKRSARNTMWEELWAIGFSKTAIYPEPQSLAEDLRRLYVTG